MKMKLALGILSFGLVLGLVGCNDRSNDQAYDEVGETRVFDAPRHMVGASQNYAPAPMPISENSLRNSRHTAVADRHVMIGELDIDN